jgi:hypothetical protein
MDPEGGGAMLKFFSWVLVLGLIVLVPSCETTPADQATFQALNHVWTERIAPRYRAYLDADPSLHTVENADLLAELKRTEAQFSATLAEAATTKPAEVK